MLIKQWQCLILHLENILGFENINLYNDLFENNYDLDFAINISDLVCFVNPNNPSGKLFQTDFIFKKAKKNLNKIFIIDESFIDYSNENSIINLLNEDPLENIIVIKSLSKAYGVPGLSGYVFTKNKEIYDFIIKNIPIWNMNSLAENFLEISLKYKSDLQNSFARAKADREYLVKKLENISFIEKIFESQASFVTFYVKDRFWSDNLSEYLLDSHNIYLKELSRIENSNGKYFRVALTDVKGIDHFINSLKMYLIDNKVSY